MASKKELQRALLFVKSWLPKIKTGHVTERQHDREFMADLYEVFGISKANYRAGFEYRVHIDGGTKRIDSLLPTVLLIEMESQNVPLVNNPKAGDSQAARYAYALADDVKPKFILSCDFNHFYIREPATDSVWETDLAHFVENIDIFGFLSGYEQEVQQKQVQVNKAAAENISKVYRSVLDSGVQPNAASLLMTRIVFALFADDTEIFSHNGVFQRFLQSTREDGSDLLVRLIDLFNTLNTPDNLWIGSERKFRYINGGLFALDIAKYTSQLGLTFSADVRKALIEASEMDWSSISPIIFGSMFEGALDPQKRHDLGAHFTSETNILKVIDGLFMDDLNDEFLQAKNKTTAGGARTKALKDLHEKIASLTFLDPACGSGNFLIVAYRELRRLEHEILEELLKDEAKNGIQMSLTFIQDNIKVEVDQFYGIELQGYAVSIARVGMWLMDHLMNLEASNLFGSLYLRIPLHSGANIVQADALQVDWIDVFKQEPYKLLHVQELDYILGNPPFIGKKEMNPYQKLELIKASHNLKGASTIDFVSGWFFKAKFIIERNPSINCAFVATNSITQGQQAPIVMCNLLNNGIRINFAHRTFSWDNNGAHVHVVIIGFSSVKSTKKNKPFLFTYKSPNDSIPIRTNVNHINEYLINAPTLTLKASNTQLGGMPEIKYGSMLIDKGHFILKDSEAQSLVKNHPSTKPYIKKIIGSKELISGIPKYVLYLKNAPFDILKIPFITDRIKKVKSFRLSSRRIPTKKLADTPTLFGEDRVSENSIIAIAKVSSYQRDYVPAAFVEKDILANGSLLQITKPNLHTFAIIESRMHTLWLRTVGGRMKSDYQYSNTLVYNTFMLPSLSNEQKKILANYGKRILDIRKINLHLSPNATLADLYNPIFMPADLRKIHETNDRFIDSVYGLKQPTDEDRIAVLIQMYKNRIAKINK